MSCVDTLRNIIPLIPDSHASLRTALRRIVDGVFLELPEDDTLWRQARCELLRVIPPDTKQQTDWQKAVVEAWKCGVR